MSEKYKVYSVLHLDSENKCYVRGVSKTPFYDLEDELSIIAPIDKDVSHYSSYYFVDYDLGEDEENIMFYEGYGLLTPRPDSPKPLETENGWVINNCPLETQIEIYDISGEDGMFHTVIREDSDTNFEFQLSDPGDYRVSVTAPLPHQTTKTVIRIS